MSAPPNTPRYLCSHLVELLADGRTQWVNLEEIWREGASLECEEEVAVGGDAAIWAGEAQFEGRITRVDRGEFGWSVEVAFSDATLWAIEKWKPGHLLNPDTLTT